MTLSELKQFSDQIDDDVFDVLTLDCLLYTSDAADD